LVNPESDGQFWVRAVNLTDQPVTLFANQSVGYMEPVLEVFRADEGESGLPTSSLKELWIDLTAPHLSLSQRQQLTTLLERHRDVFSKSHRDLGKYDNIQHSIQLKPGAVPVRQPPRRVPLALHSDVRKKLTEMLEDGVIEKSTSPWASPLVIVRKPSGEVRICVDYRRLNDASVRDSYPLPNLTETLDRLHKAKYFTSLDMVSGYHQI
jgi:hypothetical protein